MSIFHSCEIECMIDLGNEDWVRSPNILSLLKALDTSAIRTYYIVNTNQRSGTPNKPISAHSALVNIERCVY